MAPKVDRLTLPDDEVRDNLQLQLSYLAFDTSGSTRRGGWIDACNRAMPHLIGALEQLSSTGAPQHVCLLTYGDSSHIRLPLADVRHITQLPALVPSGFSSLSSAMSLLAEIVPADIAQLEADEVTFLPPTVVVVSDDLPTDTVESLVTTRRMLSEIGPPSPCLHVVHGVETDFFAFKGIGFSRVLHSRHQATPGQLAESIIDALGCEGACRSNH